MTVTLDAKLLREVLQVFEKTGVSDEKRSVTVTFDGRNPSTKPVYISSQVDGKRTFAAIMPMDADNKQPTAKTGVESDQEVTKP